MKLIVIHKNKNSTADDGNDLLHFAASSGPLSGITFKALDGNSCVNGRSNTIIALPKEWTVESVDGKIPIARYSENLLVPADIIEKAKADPWFIISNARYATQINRPWMSGILANLQADVVMVNVVPQLAAYREKVRMASESKVVGFRRLYCDSAQPAPIPADWPDHIFIKTNMLNKVLLDGALPIAFAEFIDRCLSNSLRVNSFDIGGMKLDLETEAGLISFLAAYLPNERNRQIHKSKSAMNGAAISATGRLFGSVILGKNVHIHDDAIVLGPTILADNVTIERAAVIRASVIGPNISVPPNQLVQHRILTRPPSNWNHNMRIEKNCAPAKTGMCLIQENSPVSRFRTWPRLSYASCFKRVADVVAATVVLILFVPVLPVIALAIKLSSHGSVFFKDKRQGLHGKDFFCLKFRTMMVGADNIQEKLRVVSQVDGPQFKMENDPRVSSIGRFLRETYLDEIPQFFNVLTGQMSLVGPRPSPEAENTLCPSWRDARLSVRPGITGLWQVFGTREPMKDFQEWIHYDIKYVRNLSLKTDLWICWKTIRKLVSEFVRQF